VTWVSQGARAAGPRAGTVNGEGVAAMPDERVEVDSRGDHETAVAGAPARDRFAQGSRLLGGRFEIVCELGRGGMGVVYQAIDRSRGADVALKMVPPELRHDERAILGIKREVNVALTLTHEHICRVYDFHESPEAQFIAMELVNGPSVERLLTKALREGRPGFPLEQVLDWLRPVCLALDYAHGKQVVHRDLKPGNILVGRDGAVKVTDFGLARVIHASMSKYSREGVSGTLLYMSPEQCVGKAADARSDVYSLGMLTYELLTGRTPFAEAADIAYCQLHEDVDPIPGAAGYVNAAVLAATAKKRDGRPASASAFLEMLSRREKAWIHPVTAHPGAGISVSAADSGETHRPAKAPEMALPHSDEAEKRQLESARELGIEVSQSVDLGGGVTLEMAWIPPGTFLMGSPESEPERRPDETQHQVTLTRGFWMGIHPVTQAQWTRIMQSVEWRWFQKLRGCNPSGFKGANLPVESVSWRDCQRFLQELNDRMKPGGFRLPTEAEWEYACRAGTATPFHFGQTISTEQANYDGSYVYGNGPKGVRRGETTAVGSLAANAWGLHDMHGNVWEWCADWYGDYSPGSVTDPTGPASGRCRVLRGGSWLSAPGFCRSADRGYVVPGYRYNGLGFRVVRTP